MNNTEAMKELIKGKKIRSSTWSKGEYIYFHHNKLIDESKEEIFNLNNYLDKTDDWEIYSNEKLELIKELKLLENNLEIVTSQNYIKDLSDNTINELRENLYNFMCKRRKLKEL